MVMQRRDLATLQRDSMNLHQAEQAARVLGHKHVGTRQNVQRAQCYIARSADGDTDEGQAGC
jgi:hypothetical protein